MSDKNMADVADKAVDGIARIADAVEKAAPGAWNVLISQQRTEGIVWLVVAIAYIPAAVLFWKYTAPIRNGRLTDLAVFVWACGAVGLLGIAPVVFIAIPVNTMTIVNPEYYAAKELLKAVK